LPLFVALNGLVAGIGLLNRASWSRVLSLVLAVFDQVSFSLGTVLAVYSAFVLLQTTAIEAFGACCPVERSLPRAAAV